MSKRKIMIFTTSILSLVTLLLLGLTYAYYKTKIVGNSNEKSVSVVSKKLEVTYQNESAVINAEGIEPGYSATKTFEVKNTGSETVEYSVILDNVTNTFTRTEDWTYTISVGGTELKSGTLPNTTSYILYIESIDVGETKSYTLVINYATSEENQSVDMGKELSFRINISDKHYQNWLDAESGTLLYAINRDNVVSEPLTIPGNAPSGRVYTSSASTSFGYPYISSYQNYYFAYGTGYTIDEKTGYFTLTGVKTTTDIYQNSYSELEGKYIIGYVSDTSALTREEALIKATKKTRYVDKVKSATGSSLKTNTIKRTLSSKTEAVLATTEDDYGTSYYFRGSVRNNYVNYSGMCWRIVRVQGDGTIKLTLADENGECNAETYSINNTKSAFVNDGTSYAFKSNLTYSLDEFLFQNSDTLKILNDWATNKNLDTSKLVDAEWCSDTTIVDLDGDFSSFGAYNRVERESYSYLLSTQLLLKCNMKGMEGTTGIAANAQKYIGKIALLTADEIAFAGSVGLEDEVYNYYLQTNAASYYRTLTPYRKSGNASYLWSVSSKGFLYGSSMDAVFGAVRPSVVLKSNVKISSGDGTNENPYVVV